MRTHSTLAFVVSAFAVLASSPARDAAACGCFAPPDVSHPVIQAGERIAFTARNGQITAFIQIQYSGKADQFGWLLPLPSQPTLEVGADEMFNVLQRTTDPTFIMNTSSSCNQSSGLGGCGSDSSAPTRGAGEFNGFDMNSPAVIVDSVGPYDYAVLKADDKTAMLDWLSANTYFIPAGTDEAVIPYVHPGAYFLALKLKSGKSTGDIQPVVVHYASDLPMIPIVLTSVGAVPHMGILVWLLGSARAIPRNYFHTVLDLAALDWRTGANYNDLLIRAIAEAPKHHSFVTEYAGTTQPLDGTIGVPTGNQKAMEALTNPLVFARYLHNEKFVYPFTGPLKAILAAHVTEPAELIKEGVSSDAFYGTLDVFLEQWHSRYPNATPIVFDPVATAAEVQQRVIDPLTVTSAAFKNNSYMTRFHTALSPEEMTDNPVFSFNPSLPDVPNQHFATLTTDCDGNSVLSLDTDGGIPTSWPGATRPASADSLPASLRIEMVGEAGAPQVVTDNTGKIPTATVKQSGLTTSCAVTPPPAQRGLLVIYGLLGVAAMVLRRKRGRR